MFYLKNLDVIIPRGVDNDVAIELIVKHIEEILRTPRTSPEKDNENQNNVDGKPTQITSPH